MKPKCREFRSVIYLSKFDIGIDVHIVNVISHYDNEMKRETGIIENFERPFYITKSFYRDHKQYKESECLSRLNKYYSTESDLANNIMKRLGRRKYKHISMYDINKSELNRFVYGTIDSETIIKNLYKEKCNKFTPYEIAYIDIENNPDTEVISLVTFAIKENGIIKSYTVINNEEIKVDIDITKQLYYDNITEAMPNVKAEDIELHLYKLKNEVEMLETLFEIIDDNAYKFDYLTGWNVFYDISMIAKALYKYGLDPKDYFGKRIPEKYRFFKLIEDKKDYGGKPYQAWHIYKISAPYIVVDMMATYFYNRRTSNVVKGGLGLDNVMLRVLGFGKLKLVDLDLPNKDWHLQMAKKYPNEYTAYNIHDVLLMLFKNETDNDLSIKLPTLLGHTVINNYDKATVRSYTDLYYYYLKENRVLGNTRNLDWKDFKSLGKNKWVVNVDLSKIDTGSSINIYNDNITVDKGKNMLMDEYGYKYTSGIYNSRIFGYVDDIDVTSAYPSAIGALNLSPDTVMREVIDIEDIDKEEFKEQNIELLTGVSSYLNYNNVMLNRPTVRDIDIFMENYVED
jgi:hypothetical protein